MQNSYTPNKLLNELVLPIRCGIVFGTTNLKKIFLQEIIYSKIRFVVRNKQIKQ